MEELGRTKRTGGELHLHQFGVLGPKALVKYVEFQSRFYDGTESTGSMHTVLVVDSCFSGRFVTEVEAAKATGDWERRSCHLTVQSACSEDQVVPSRLFTPAWLALQQPSFREAVVAVYNNLKLSEEPDAWLIPGLPTPKFASTSPDKVTVHFDTLGEPLFAELTIGKLSKDEHLAVPMFFFLSSKFFHLFVAVSQV